jgi:hypothetical protein
MWKLPSLYFSLSCDKKLGLIYVEMQLGLYLLVADSLEG